MTTDPPYPVCRRHVVGTDVVNDVCHQCGHADVLHPGRFTNPDLVTCLACLVNALATVVLRGAPNPPDQPDRLDPPDR